MAKDHLVEINTADFQADGSIVSLTNKALQQALFHLEEPNSIVEVIFVSPDIMCEVNEESRGKNETTDVLSFPEPEETFVDGTERRYLGEIYISPEVAKNKGNPVSRLLIHGLLHLLGFSHKGRSDTIEMERLEDEIIKNIDIDK